MSKYRILYGSTSAALRLGRIWFGSDGSYYFSMPIPTTDRAVLAKFTVNYAADAGFVALPEVVDLAEAKRADKEIKFTHHPDGFVQFSGANLVSGKEPDGTIRGIGTMSWPLWDPVRGPAFALAITKPYDLLAEVPPRPSDVLIAQDGVAAVPDLGPTGLGGALLPGPVAALHPLQGRHPLPVRVPPLQGGLGTARSTSARHGGSRRLHRCGTLYAVCVAC